MTHADGLVAAYLLDGKGGGCELDWEGIRRWSPADGLLWVHLDYQGPVARAWLERESELDGVLAQALLAEETRPRSVAMAPGWLVILRGVNTNPGADPEDMVSLRIWAEPTRIITTRKRRLLSIQDLRDALARGAGPRTPGEFLAEISDRLVARMSDVIDAVEKAVDEAEEKVLDGESRELRLRLSAVRRETIQLRRYLAPQREAMARLQSERIEWLTHGDRLQLREVADRVTRYIEDLDAARERASVTSEELASRLSEQLNRRMYILSLVAGVFLPLGFLTGLLGINVGGIPGAQDPAAFVHFTLLLLLVVLIQMLVFRWRKWF